MPRLIDADRLLRPDMIRMCYHLPNGDIAMPIGDIKHAPTVDAAPVVHGRWISDEAYGHIKIVNGIPDGSCTCSVCGKWLTGSDEYDVYGNYCPACGAKMDLEEQCENN